MSQLRPYDVGRACRLIHEDIEELTPSQIERIGEQPEAWRFHLASLSSRMYSDPAITAILTGKDRHLGTDGRSFYLGFNAPVLRNATRDMP